MSTVCWTLFNNALTAVTVGKDAIALLDTNIVYLTDLKTLTKRYYKADNPTSGAGICLLNGHNRFPLFVFAESVLRPSIHIIKYPELTKFATFKTNSNTTYADLRFTEHDHLAVMSGYPSFKLQIWNFRTQQLIVEETTYKQISAYSLYCSLDNLPRIALLSQWHKELICWNVCVTAEGTQFHEVSTIPLSTHYTESVISSLCFTENGNLYIVNDYGMVSSVKAGQFHLQEKWQPQADNPSTPRRHFICAYKQNLFVANQEKVYCLKHKASQWEVEWTLSETNLKITKIISNSVGEIFLIEELGNVYRVDPQKDTAILTGINTTNRRTLDTALLNGIKEEVVVVLSSDGELRLMELIRPQILSTVSVPNGVKIAVHNINPFVAIITTTGQVHCISYEKLRAPVVMAVVEIGEFSLEDARIVDNMILIADCNRSFHLIVANFKKNVFFLGASTIPEPDIWIIQIYIYNEKKFIALITRDSNIHSHYYSTELWSYAWVQEEQRVIRREFDLPFPYRKFSFISSTSKNSVEMYGIRKRGGTFLDGYILNNDELVLNTTMKTVHHTKVSGIHGSKNLMTYGASGTIIHFRSHKKSPKPYVICRFVQLCYTPRVIKKASDCFNGKYMILLNAIGSARCFRLPSLADNLRENTIISDTYQVITPKVVVTKKVKQTEALVVKEFTPAELGRRADIERMIKELGTEVGELIDYDISVTGKKEGIFRKFCLNDKWLSSLNEEARLLFEAERNSMLESIADQTRIRDWIMNLISGEAAYFSVKLRALFSNTILESYGIRKKYQPHIQFLDLYRFYEMEELDEDNELANDADDEANEGGRSDAAPKARKRWVIQGTAYEHEMAEEFRLQDKNIVTSNQMHNETIKHRVIIQDSLKLEFNKVFVDAQKYKQEIMDNVLHINTLLQKIYSNMNCMLCLLKMDAFEPPELSVPMWMHDENIERILTVDDSEIKAINRRAKKKVVAAHKSGRMLLWAKEFWTRALMIMMDGVLEKLWEEEIKRDIPIPEFMLKKQDHEYTLEDQKLLREYNEKVHLLELDRRKYLRILNENEAQTLDLKKNQILKLNERIAATALLKLKYDFAIKQGRLVVANTKINSFKRSEFAKRVSKCRANINKINLYISKYTKLSDSWEKSVSDIKLRLETLAVRDKNIEREFRSKYLNSIPSHLILEMKKLYKRRPKMDPKWFNSTLVFLEVAARVKHRSHRNVFPLFAEVLEYLEALDALDDIKNAPTQLDAKHWDGFVKLRRLKIGNELKIKGTGVQLLDGQNSVNAFVRNVASLKGLKIEADSRLEETTKHYFDAILNRNLKLTLNMGQVETISGGTVASMANCILMNIDDINAVNAKIKAAGAKKLKAMEKVAFFRRQVIFKEWEHKVIRANIDYLKYMLQVIEKCKVTMEFLQILRNWNRVKEEKSKKAIAVGLIERVIEQKIMAYRKNLDRIIEKIDIVKTQIDQVKRKNQQVNKHIIDVKVSVAISTTQRDFLVEEKREREQNERMAKIKAHRSLLDSVKADYAKILELSTILELQRLRTYPTLSAPRPECID